jgi:hypothetical protein
LFVEVGFILLYGIFAVVIDFAFLTIFVAVAPRAIGDNPTIRASRNEERAASAARSIFASVHTDYFCEDAPSPSGF